MTYDKATDDRFAALTKALASDESLRERWLTESEDILATFQLSDDDLTSRYAKRLKFFMPWPPDEHSDKGMVTDVDKKRLDDNEDTVTITATGVLFKKSFRFALRAWVTVGGEEEEFIVKPINRPKFAGKDHECTVTATFKVTERLKYDVCVGDPHSKRWGYFGGGLDARRSGT